MATKKPKALNASSSSPGRTKNIISQAAPKRRMQQTNQPKIPKKFAKGDMVTAAPSISVPYDSTLGNPSSSPQPSVSVLPTLEHSYLPSLSPIVPPAPIPSHLPSYAPSVSNLPTQPPSSDPSNIPSLIPTISMQPSIMPSISHSSSLAPTTVSSSQPTPSDITSNPTFVLHQTVLFTYIMGLPSAKDGSGTTYSSSTLSSKGTHWYILYHVSTSIFDTVNESEDIPETIEIEGLQKIQNTNIIPDHCPVSFGDTSKSCFRIVTSMDLNVFSTNTQTEEEIERLIGDEISDYMHKDDTLYEAMIAPRGSDASPSSSIQLKYIGLGSILVKPKDLIQKNIIQGSTIGIAVGLVVSLILIKCFQNKCRQKRDSSAQKSTHGIFASLSSRFQQDGSTRRRKRNEKEVIDDSDSKWMVTPNTTFSTSPTRSNHHDLHTVDWSDSPHEISSSDRNEDWKDSPPHDKEIMTSTRASSSIKSSRGGNEKINPYHVREDSLGSSNLSVEREGFQDHPSTPDISVGSNSTGTFSLDNYFRKRNDANDDNSEGDDADKGWWN